MWVRPVLWLFFAAILWGSSTPAQASTLFSQPHFLEEGKYGLGIEPVLVTTNGNGFATNLRTQYGLTDLQNLSTIVGAGSGRQKFRIGGGTTFDFFPDLEGQPGIGLAVQSIYYRYKKTGDSSYGQLEVSATPYIHKTFYNEQDDQVEPYLGLPFGTAFRQNEYNWFSQLTIGGRYRPNKSTLHLFTELNVNLSHAETTISGGVWFTP